MRAINLTTGMPRVVIKVGSSFLTSRKTTIQRKRLAALVEQLIGLKAQGVRPVLVSSGAIACGMQLLKYTRRPTTISELQAAAAIGQSHLMHAYEVLFRKSGYLSAQILLTGDDFHNRERYLNARNTLLRLLEQDVFPVVNENDTVAVEEIKFGDNDRLSALVAAAVEARLLIILSDVDGLYDRQGRVMESVREITADLTRLASGTRKSTSVGGMVSKLQAAKVAVAAGVPVVIANGSTPDILQRVVGGEQIGTWFVPSPTAMSGKKGWIAYGRRAGGSVTIDAGAATAIRDRGKSLLPGGITAVQGTFKVGDMISILDAAQQEIARGLTNYTAQEIDRIKGARTADIIAVLGYKPCDEVVHRNNLVLLH